ncbi:hypothetical protein JCM8097_004147 [Rhodosporidiobolus ruineniae]
MAFGNDSLALVTARTVATAGLGLAFGLTASIPLWTFPALYDPAVRSTEIQRFRSWSKLYDQGRKTMMILVPTLSSILIATAYFVRPSPLYLPSNFVSRHRQAFLLGAAALTFSVGGWTGIFMEKLNWSLKGTLKKIDADEDAAGTIAAYAQQAKDADKAIATTWAKQHAVRIALFAGAFSLALSELAFA